MEPVPSDPKRFLPLSPLDLQVLLVLARGDLYGYAIMKEVREVSGGVLSPEIGSLYRVLARLTDAGWVAEANPPFRGEESHRGKPRKYYRLTDQGWAIAQAEVRRLEGVIRGARALGTEPAR